ncbi:glycosyltransferase 87 family protein [Klenkia sp. PcliD-1-E]|uniref:glycosyltransferase 87 family protein n=1 Tax=Klenkia sp. PcliD-1-E TaxID=2954492 RepID=UPI002097346F|nr:glycosyltransferase 87 family protein [Klenkia sp. PcliD-1-E]MCO7220281.1 glycosyltransferase 87 family protein [Klenkia sp. PcliD-1-E]
MTGQLSRAGTRPDRPADWRLAGVVAASALGSLLVFTHLVQNAQHDWFDLSVYDGAVGSWRKAGLSTSELYDYLKPGTPYGFTYPPFAALLMLPMTSVSLQTAVALNLVASGLLVAAGTAWVLHPLLRRTPWPAWAVLGTALPLVLLSEPVRQSMAFGQVNLFLAALVLADVAALRRGARWAGVGIGLAVAIKLTPAVLLLYLLITRRHRALLVAAGTAAGATLLTLVLVPAASVRFWTQALWETDRVGKVDITDNQSLLGLLSRIHGGAAHPPHALWAALAAAVLAVALVRGLQAFRAGDDLAGFTLAGIAGGLVSPISWTHHLWPLTVAGLLLVVRGGRSATRGAVAVGAVLALGVNWWANGPDAPLRGLGPITLLVENAYVWLALVLLVALPTRPRERAVTG